MASRGHPRLSWGPLGGCLGASRGPLGPYLLVASYSKPPFPLRSLTTFFCWKVLRGHGALAREVVRDTRASMGGILNGGLRLYLFKSLNLFREFQDPAIPASVFQIFHKIPRSIKIPQHHLEAKRISGRLGRILGIPWGRLGATLGCFGCLVARLGGLLG